MSFFFSNVRRPKKGAFWPSGEPRMCVRCAFELRPRRKQSVVVADLKQSGIKFTIPVGYCKEHVPPELQEKVA